MKTLILIRTYPKDDFIAYRTMQTFKTAGVEADFIFFAEQGEYKWIRDEKKCFRPACGNFGGKDGVLASLEGYRTLFVDQYDKIIISDSDITVHKNPLGDYDFGGIQDLENLRHFSGQMLIMSTWVFKRMLEYDGYPQLFNYFLDHMKHIADDTIFSWVITSFTDGKDLSGYWSHEKMHHLEPKE